MPPARPKRAAAFRRKQAASAPGSAAAASLPRRAAEGWGPRGLIALAAIAAFGRALPYPLLRSWDDARFILDNADAHRPSLAALARIFGEQHFEAYHPLHLVSYWLDVPWAGDRPWVLHGVSLAIWLSALWLAHAALRELGVAAWPAAFVTLLCGIHPIQVEAVVWVTGRKDALAMAFACASLLLHLRARSSWDRSAWLSRLCYLSAVLSKTTALPLPALFFTLDVLVRRVRWRDALVRQLPSLAAAAAVSFGVFQIWQEHRMVRTTLGGPELALLRWSQTLGHQLLTAAWPANVAPMYPTGDIARLDPGRSLAVVGWLAAAMLAFRFGRTLALAGLIGFGLLALPSSNLVPMYFPLQDRYLSLPLVGLALAAAGVLVPPTPKRGLPAVLIALAGLALGLRTLDYTGRWASDLVLWGHAASTQPDAEYAWLKLGEVRRDAGDYEGAINALRAAVHAAPLRKLSHASLFEAVARRDERIRRIEPSAARALAQRYYEQLDSGTGLQALAQELKQRGYVRTLELPLQLVLARAPLPDDALGRIANIQLKQGNRSLARFYVAIMSQPPKAPELRALLDEPSFRVLP